jgi:iron complex transport system ATP-binding protein
MLNAISLGLSYGSKQVLHEINLTLLPGELLGVIGPNGSGKTTLIRCLSRVLKPSNGSVTLANKNLEEFTEQERARNIAVVPQSAVLPPAFTILESVSLGRTPHLGWLGHMGAHDLEIVRRAMHSCEVEQLKDRRISELSGGEQQRVLLARALAQDCPVLLLDEPTAHLDLHHQVALLSLIRRMAKEQNLAVLIAIHDLNLASLYADRLVLLTEGRVSASGKPSEVLTTETLQSAYQVPLQVHVNPQHGSPWVVLERP